MSFLSLPGEKMETQPYPHRTPHSSPHQSQLVWSKEGFPPASCQPAACSGKRGSEQTKQTAPRSPLPVATHSGKLVTAALGR